jgi:hypothetical protein
MDKKLGISVVIPTYNRAEFIGKAIKSAQSAIEPIDEIIVIDDGSTDNTQEVIKPFLSKIRYIRTENKGAGAARNRGIQEAQKPLVAFLDSDDLWMSDKLTLQRVVMEKYPEVVCCSTNFLDKNSKEEVTHRNLDNWIRHPRVGFLDSAPTWSKIYGQGVPFSSLGQLPEGREDFQVHVGNIYPSLMESLCVWMVSVVVRKELLDENDVFPTDLPTYEEWEWFGKMARNKPFAYLDCEAAVQLTHDQPRLTDANAVKCADTRLALLNRVWGQDTEFLKTHHIQFQRMVSKQHIIKAVRFLWKGDIRNAVNEYQLTSYSCLRDKLVASLPISLAASLLRCWQKIILNVLFLHQQLNLYQNLHDIG